MTGLEERSALDDRAAPDLIADQVFQPVKRFETQPRRPARRPRGTAMGQTVRESADSVGQRSDTGGGGLATT
ncbi:hypothetical protein ACFWAZ_05275 [Streptomyces collinus]|uniref:hypothetical protein n=1 Tax=Streptomyces collinus TaxID=42684 RepID=UPI0036648F5F